MLTDIQIAQQTTLEPINNIAKKLAINDQDIEQYGKYKAKITASPSPKANSKLILVTAINPTPYGEGKTTVSIGLADGLSKIGKKVCLALREPSLGPVFGVKGGATGGGHAQVVPMEDINLHFTGDFHAITSANNLLSALIDNHIKQGNLLHLDINKIEHKRCLDLNDRALRVVECGLGGAINGVPRVDGFDITAASEIMAILCLAKDITDLKNRFAEITIGYNTDGNAVYAKDLHAEDAMAILMKDAMYPNLVQTLEGTPAFIHGGPFANIAHGCNSIRATNLALTYADYVITEAGFGAELGAEKFYDIKCRISQLQPQVVVLVATARSLKYNGGAEKENIGNPDLTALKRGLCNMQGHINNLKKVFNQQVVVAINKFYTDSEEELSAIKVGAQECGVEAIIVNGWQEGGLGCIEIAKKVVDLSNSASNKLTFSYNLNDSIVDKINSVAKNVYGAGKVTITEEAQTKIDILQKTNYASLPVCIAKTQYSFSTDPTLLGRPTNFEFFVRDIKLRSGSGFIVVVSGAVMLMPGLPAKPAAIGMKIDSASKIEGLF